MPMHPRARNRMVVKIQVAATPYRRDLYLDQYADALLRATEWDADQWGFNPSRWMEDERAELAARGGRDWPTEPMMRVASCKSD